MSDFLNSSVVESLQRLKFSEKTEHSKGKRGPENLEQLSERASVYGAWKGIPVFFLYAFL